MTVVTRESMLQRIRSNIEKYGHHVYLVTGGQVPRYAYTIGLSPVKGAELILAGAATYSDEDVKRIIDTVASASELSFGSSIAVGAGAFSLRTVDSSWAVLLARGAMDYYKRTDIPTLQAVPDSDHSTIDVPDLSRPWAPESEPLWRWLTDPWEYKVPDRSVAVTNLDALRGNPITEAVRWEVDQWELFAGAGPDVPREDIREVPLGTLLAGDPSLAAITTLEVGKGLWRDPTDLRWHNWERRA